MDNNRISEDDLSLTQKITILLLGENCSEPIKGKLWFQKELFLIAQNLPELEEETEFEPDFIGPFSEIADEELDHLRTEGLVEKTKEKLTPLGEQIKKQLFDRFPSEVKEFVGEIKLFLNDLSRDELLGFIYYTYPKMRVESVEFERISKIRKEIAVCLFKKSKVSIGKAAAIAGVNQEDFIEVLHQKGVKVYSA
jgi:predicted HTH domain antitoxin